MAQISLLRAASRLLGALGESESALIGGLAVSAYGYVRATRDVDVLVSIPLDEARRRLSAHGIASRIRRGDLLEGEFPVLKGHFSQVPFDIVSQLVPLEPERIQSVDIGTLRLRVVDFETLARLKLKAGSPKDLWDLAILLLMDPKRQARAFELAEASPELAAQLRAYIEDRRARKEALERAQEQRRRTLRKKHK